MRLITHNFLICNVAKCVATVQEDNANKLENERKMNFPLQIIANEDGIETREDDYNEEFIKNILQKLDWRAFCQGAKDMGCTTAFPEECPKQLNEEQMKEIHHALMQIDLISGKLVCPHCGRVYVVEQGIPNMLLNEDEV